jgi:hypothetical protein
MSIFLFFQKSLVFTVHTVHTVHSRRQPDADVRLPDAVAQQRSR